MYEFFLAELAGKPGSTDLLTVDQLDEGTTFKIDLPHADGVTAEPVVIPMPANLSGGGETILLVEDDEACAC